MRKINNIMSGQIFDPNLNIMNADRPTKRDSISCHGGVMITVYNKIKIHEVCTEHLPTRIRNSCRIVVLENQDPNYVILLYNPPSGSLYRLAEEEIDPMLNFVETFRAAM